MKVIKRIKTKIFKQKVPIFIKPQILPFLNFSQIVVGLYFNQNINIMKNWKDKVLGIFAGIGIMSLLMASNNQSSQTGRYLISTSERGNVGIIITKMDSQNGDMWRWDKKGNKYEGKWIKFVENE